MTTTNIEIKVQFKSDNAPVVLSNKFAKLMGITLEKYFKNIFDIEDKYIYPFEDDGYNGYNGYFVIKNSNVNWQSYPENSLLIISISSQDNIENKLENIISELNNVLKPESIEYSFNIIEYTTYKL